MGTPVTVGIPNLTQLCYKKLSEIYRYQFGCCMMEKLSTTANKIYGNQIFCSCVNVIGVTSNETVLDLCILSPQYIAGGYVSGLVKDPLWNNCFHLLCMTERRIVISVPTKLCWAVGDDENHCYYSNSVERSGRSDELVADVGSGTAECVEELENTSVQVSADESSTSLIVPDDFSADYMSCTNQDGNVTSENIDSRKIRTENENEDSIFDVPYLDRKEQQIENEKDVSTSVLIYRKQGGAEINNKVPVIEVHSLESKNFEAKATQNVLTSDDIYLDIKQLKKKKENLMLLDISDNVYVTLLQHLMMSNSKVIKFEKLLQSFTENKQKFTEDMNVKLDSYEAGNSDNKSVTTMNYFFRCSTGLGLSSRLHAQVPHLQKLCSLYNSLRVCSPNNCCNQFLVCVFMQESNFCCYILKIRRTKKRDTARMNSTEIGRSRINFARIEAANIAAANIAAVNRIDLADKGEYVMYDNRAIALVLLLSTNDIITSQKQLPSWPLANRNRIFSSHASGELSVLNCSASQLLPEDTEKTLVTRLGTFCSTHHEKNTCRQNNCQIVSPSPSNISVTHKAKATSEHNNVQELSSVCKFESKQQIGFHAGKPNHGDVQIVYDSSDDTLFSIKPLRGKILSILLKNEHGRNTEGNMNFSTLDVLDSIRLKKIELRIEIPCLTPSQTLTNVCVNMLPRSGSICGIPWSEFERETMRLASFATYPASAAKSPANLASCGFVYVGNGSSDRVKCFFCSVEKESWEMNDDIDDIHKSLSPACPMVIVQFSNNVASNISSPGLSRGTGYSSSVPYGSESLRPMAAANAVTSSLGAASGRANSGYDDVDSHRTTAGSQPTTVPATAEPNFSSTREAAVTSSLLADRRINTPGSATAPSLSVPEMLQQNTNSTDRSNMVNLASQNYHNSDSLNEESIRNQQNLRGANQDNISHHPNINTQVYAIPPDTNTTVAPDTSNSVQTNSQLTYQLLGIFHERPKFPNYAVLARRLQSFEGWPEHHPIAKEDLVKSGLFFAGYGDCCKCFFCGGGLRNWENDDNAYVEHARWFDKCSYIRQFMGQEFVEAVQCLKNRGGTITFKDVTDYMQTQGQSIQNLFNDRKISDDVAVKSLIDAGYNIETVSRAAISLRESGELLSADVILRKMREQESDINGAAAAVANENTNPEDVPDEGRLQALKEQNYALRSNLTCKICMDKEVKIVFLPCGHLISCQECAVALQDCPLCRSHIRARARANIN